MKFRYMVVFAALAFLASCSNQENTQLVSEEDNEAWVYDESLPVPVTFAEPEVSIESKALISGQIKGATLPEGLDIGVFALATGEGAQSWGTDAEGTLINNKRVVTGTGGSITFDPVVYYPMTSDQAFSFFGYYPYNNDVTLSTNCEVSLDVNGYTDILWGKAYATPLQDGLNGYNAAYVRRLKQAEGGEDRMPKLAFKHVLTALKFQAQLEDAGLTSDEVKVSRLRLVNATNKILMRIAKSEEDVAGYLEPELVSQGKGDIWIRQVASASGSGSLNQVLNSDPADLGAPVLVEPGQSYTVEIDIVIGGNTTTLQCPVERVNKEQPFMAGYEYTLLVKVKSPVEVEIVETSLEEWKPGGGTGDITFGE